MAIKTKVKDYSFLALMSVLAGMFLLLFFVLFVPIFGTQHVIQHWRKKQSWIDQWEEAEGEMLDDYV